MRMPPVTPDLKRGCDEGSKSNERPEMIAPTSPSTHCAQGGRPAGAGFSTAISLFGGGGSSLVSLFGSALASLFGSALASLFGSLRGLGSSWGWAVVVAAGGGG